MWSCTTIPDTPINFKDYVFYYCYEGGMGTGKTFGAGDAYGSYEYGSGEPTCSSNPVKRSSCG